MKSFFLHYEYIWRGVYKNNKISGIKILYRSVITFCLIIKKKKKGYTRNKTIVICVV